MHGRPDFRLYHSNALEVLAGLLAEQVARVPADGDWLRPDVVLVPQFSMRRWLQQAMAEHSGICANLRFLTPGEFVDSALDANLAPAPEGDRLAPEVLRWHLLRELNGSPPPRLAGFLDAADPLKGWSLAVALAGTYEKYQAWRRDLLQRWERGLPEDKDDWQATLWRRIARQRAHRARRIGEYLQRFGAEGADTPAGLPPRLFVFACQNVSPDVLQLIASQARAGEQHFYLHTPARAFWGDAHWNDLRSWAAGYQPANDDHFLGAQPNPLLAAWGQAGRDFIAALGSGEAVHASFESVAFAEPPRDTLLGRLQADVLDNTFVDSMFVDSAFIDRSVIDSNAAPARHDASAWPRAQVDRGDGSLQFHACHTRLREVQVLHDQLRALLEPLGSAAEPRLQPRDIAVLAPDIDLYAPHIEAVFGGALGSERELPYTIADTSPLASAPLAEAFTRLLELPLRPLTVGDAIDLLAVPAIAARFGIDDHDRGAVQRWLEDAGARWGLDRADRARHGAAGDGEVDVAEIDGAYTFEFALDRLLLGYATGSDDDIAGIAPWPGLEGNSATALDALLRFLAMLRDVAARLTGPQPPAAWARDLERLLDGAFEVERDSAEAAVLKRLRECVAGFARSAALADYAAPVEHALVLEHVREELARSDARAPFLSGGICFGRMVPMRLIPFRVICLLGLDDGAFPARDGHDPLNRIVQQLDTRERRVGDPSRRDADRYLFLQLFASAGRVLYLSWCGMDPRDGSEREPSALVSELLDAAAQYHVASDGEARAAVRSALVVQHALQPFSPAAFGAPLPDEDTIEPRRFSFDPRWRDARAAATDSVPSPPFATAPLPRETPVGTVLALSRLQSALGKPHRAYLRDGLGLRLPEEESPLAEHEPFGRPDPLARWALRNLAFEHWLRQGRRPEPRALHAYLLARAQVAPGADGLASVETLLADVTPFAHCALEQGFTAVARAQPLEQTAGTRVLRGALADVRTRHGRDGVLRVALRPEGRHGGHALRHGLDWLLASLLELPLYEILSDKGEDPRLDVREPLQDKAQVVASLDALLALREQALRAPLPFLPKSGFEYMQALREFQAKRADGGDAADAAMEKARKRWCGDDNGGVGEAGAETRLALRGRDPFVDGDAAGRARFQRIARELFGAFSQARAIDAEALL